MWGGERRRTRRGDPSVEARAGLLQGGGVDAGGEDLKGVRVYARRHEGRAADHPCARSTATTCQQRETQHARENRRGPSRGRAPAAAMGSVRALTQSVQ